MKLVRSLVFNLSDQLDSNLFWLLKEYRLITNKCIRFSLQHDCRSKKTLSSAYYQILRTEHDVYSQIIPSSMESSLSILKNYRRRIKKRQPTKVPYQRKLFCKMENQAYKLNRETGLLNVPIRAGQHVILNLPLSNWHKQFLSDNSWKLGSLTITPHKIIITINKASPTPYEPESILAFDTNEDSLDGILLTNKEQQLQTVPFNGIRKVQQTHKTRRDKLQKKKAHDRRMKRRLMRREGRREHNRVNQRLHNISKRLVDDACQQRSVIVLEDLTGLKPKSRYKKTNQRISNWPRRELHRQILYKAELKGVPVKQINPKNTSRTCPVCGKIKKGRLTRTSPFRCMKCGWTMNWQHNAGLNVAKTAMSQDIAKGLWFDPGAIPKDVMIVLYTNQGTRHERRELE